MDADAVVAQIARAETDGPTRRAAVMHCLERNVEHFPPGLISSTRVLVDCIDVMDVLGDSFGRGGGNSRGGYGTHGRGTKQGAGAISSDILQATLFLFDDKLMICKRNASSSAPGRILAGLDETEKVAKVGLGLGLVSKKVMGGSVAGKPGGIVGSSWGLSCRGVIDIGDVVATDVGGAGEYQASSGWVSLTFCRPAHVFGGSSTRPTGPLDWTTVPGDDCARYCSPASDWSSRSVCQDLCRIVSRTGQGAFPGEFVDGAGAATN